MSPNSLSRLWLVGTTVRRSLAQWRLLAAITTVAVLAGALVTSLGLLVTATEQGGVRRALNSLPASQSTIELRLQNLTASIEQARTAMDASVASVLGSSGTFTGSGIALSELSAVPTLGPDPGLAYLGELDGISSEASLIDGGWPQSTGDGTTSSPVPVTMPAPAGRALGLTLGSRLVVDTGPTAITTEVVGFYEADDADDSFWSRDILHGIGSDPNFSDPAVSFYKPTPTFGPLIVAPGSLDRTDVALAFHDVEYQPDFSTASVDQLAPLIARLASADIDTRRDVGSVAEGAFYYSDAADAVAGVASGLVVTRSTVIVIGLLLAVLAAVAMGQAARLFTDAREGERRLMGARGASGAQILSLATLEACVIGTITLLASPPLANLLYRIFAAQPPMVAAGMPANAAISSTTWATAAALAILFVAIVLAPLLRRDGLVPGRQHAKGRQRSAGVMRSGIDLAIVVLAAVAYWQLRSYRTIVDPTDLSLGVDPVLAAGPALVLLAGALVCVRLIPLAARAVEWIGSRVRGVVIALAAWEIGRRSRRSISAVLLLSLALAVGTFSLSFLSTWKQSQLDQAFLAVGAPVRVVADVASVREQPVALGEGAIGAPQPVIRRSARVAGPNARSEPGDDPSGVGAQVLGLPALAREMIDRGRLSEEGGTKIREQLAEPVPTSTGIDLPRGARGLAATIRIGDPSQPLVGVVVHVRAILEGANGLTTTASLGSVDVDGVPHSVRGVLDSSPQDTRRAPPLRFVGYQVSFTKAALSTDAPPAALPPGASSAGTPTSAPLEPATSAEILVKDLAALHQGASENADIEDYQATALQLDGNSVWFGHNANELDATPVAGEVPRGWQLRLSVVIPDTVDMQPALFALVGWTPVAEVDAVTTSSLADDLRATEGSSLTLLVQGVRLRMVVAGRVALVPGAATSEELTAGSIGVGESTRRGGTVVLDQSLLSRALAQSGITDVAADEWWVDVPSGRGQAYLDTHASAAGAPLAQSGEVLGTELQESPLRVGTQAALWLAILAGALLAAIGFAMHSTATLRARRLELAQLRAIGLSRRGLVTLIAAESLVLCALGTLFGVAISLLLVWLVGPLVAVSPTGVPPVPSVMIEVPWASVGLLAVEIVAVLGAVVLIVARIQRGNSPADLLRGGEL